MTSEGQPDHQPTSAHHDQDNLFGYDQQAPPAPYGYPPPADPGASTHSDTVPPAPDRVRGSASVPGDVEPPQPAASQPLWPPPVSPSGAQPAPPAPDPVPRPAAYPVPPQSSPEPPGPPPRVPIDEPPTSFTPAGSGPTRAAAAVPTANRVTPPPAGERPSFTSEPRVYQTAAGAPRPVSPPPPPEQAAPMRPVSPRQPPEQAAPMRPVSPLPTRTPGETPLPSRTPGETPLPHRADPGPPLPRPPRPRQTGAGLPVYSDLLTPAAAPPPGLPPPPLPPAPPPPPAQHEPPPPPPMQQAPAPMPPAAPPMRHEPPPQPMPPPGPPPMAPAGPPPMTPPGPPPMTHEPPPQPTWQAYAEPPHPAAAPAEPYIPQPRIGLEPSSPPPAATGPDGEDGSPPGKSGPSTGLIVGLVLIGATVLVALALSVPFLLQQLRGSGESGSYTVGDCVVQAGEDAQPADCSEPNAYQIVSQVDSQEECDPTQPAIRVDGPPAEVYCLAPAAAEPEPEPEPTTE